MRNAFAKEKAEALRSPRFPLKFPGWTLDYRALGGIGVRAWVVALVVGYRVQCLGSQFSRMRSRKVLVLRLRVWGLGVDAKSVRSIRKRTQAFAVCSQASAPKIVAKRRIVVSFGLAFGEERTDRRGEKREKRREGERVEAREDRRERRGERGEERDERRERGERRGRGERRERREDDPRLKFPDWCRVWGVVMFAMYVSRVCIRVRGSYQVFLLVGADLNVSHSGVAQSLLLSGLLVLQSSGFLVLCSLVCWSSGILRFPGPLFRISSAGPRVCYFSSGQLQSVAYPLLLQAQVLCRRVPVVKIGVQAPEVTKKSLHVFAKRPQSVREASHSPRTIWRPRESRLTVVTFGHLRATMTGLGSRSL